MITNVSVGQPEHPGGHAVHASRAVDRRHLREPDADARLLRLRYTTFPLFLHGRWPIAGKRSRDDHRQRHDRRECSDQRCRATTSRLLHGACSSAPMPLCVAPTSFPARSPARCSRTAHGTSATPGPYTFTDNGWPDWAVRPDGTTASCKASATPTNGINPRSTAGFNVAAAPAVTLPQNSFNQEQAVLDGIGVTTAPTAAASNAASSLRTFPEQPIHPERQRRLSSL